MKTLKICAIAAIITSVIILSCAVAMSAQAESGEFYPRLTIVMGKVAIDNGLWVVSCHDKNGNIWEFFDDVDEWNRGDICNLLMWNMGEQEEEEDDVIIEVYWEGYTENVDEFFQANGWR